MTKNDLSLSRKQLATQQGIQNKLQKFEKTLVQNIDKIDYLASVINKLETEKKYSSIVQEDVPKQMTASRGVMMDYLKPTVDESQKMIFVKQQS